MARPEFTPAISLGNLIQIAVLLIGLGGAWAVLSTNLDYQASRIAANSAAIREMETRVRTLEADAARADERFTNILALLSRIDNRLERIEKGDRP